MKKVFNLTKSLTLTNEGLFIYAAAALMLLALPLRLYNLNYNSPFNDEAIYIIVGLMGVFERDWWTYNASSWIPGVQYFYPSLTAIAYNIGGIIGSRFLNVLLSIFAIQILFLLSASIYQKINNQKKITLSQITAGTITALVIGGSEISHYISRLATYDMPSFMFLFLGLLLLNETKPVQFGNRYFLAFLFLSLSYLAKIITSIYLPFIIVYFYFQAKSVGIKNLFFYKRYFLIPLALVLTIFAVFSGPSLAEYYSSQQSLGKATLEDIWNLVWVKASIPLVFAFVGALGLYFKRQFGILLTLSGAAVLIIVFHLVTSRTLSMDKHLFLFIAFLSLIAGLGIASILQSISKMKVITAGAVIALVLALGHHWITGYQKLEYYNHQWKNMSVISGPIQQNVKAGDKILAESGSAVILATYYKNFPPNTSTFDWLEYRNQVGDKAYAMAVRDGYFDLIQLESNRNSKSERNANLSQLVKRNLDSNYVLIFEKDGFMLYKRAF